MKKYKVGKFEFDLYTILLFVLVIVAFLIRVYHIDYLTLWVDEYVHVNRARYFPQSPLFTDDNNGILLTMIIIPFFKLLGVGEFWARFPSVIFGTLLVPVLYLFVKKYFNRNVALLSAGLVTFSTYLIFWSRISRNYEIFVFFFILLIYFLGMLLQINNQSKFKLKYLWITLVVLVLSILSHQLTFLIIYGILFYYVLLFIDNLVHKRFNFLGIEAIITYLFFIFSAIVFIPPVQEMFKSVLLLFLPARVAVWVLPDTARLSELMTTEPYKAFQIYYDVIKYDYNALYLLGFAGFICAIIRYRKAGYYITSIFVVLFLLMSFVFREPSLARYLIYIYPLFLVAIALSLDTIILLLRKIKIPVKPEYATIVLLAVLCFLPTAKASVTMVQTKEHGQVISPHLDYSFYFPDWKTSLAKIKPFVGENDVLISTIPAYVSFYLGKNSYQFRQRMYDTNQHQYINLPIDTIQPNANSTPALEKLLNNADKAWLIADYYFNNVMTNPETKAYVIQNMKFEYDMSNEYVSVFSRDKNKPQTQSNTIFEFIHSEYSSSIEYAFDMQPFSSNMVLLLDMEGIVYDNQAIVTINGNSIGVLRQQGKLFQQNGDSKNRQTYIIPIPGNLLQPNINKVTLGLNSMKMYKKTRFAVYNMSVQPAQTVR